MEDNILEKKPKDHITPKNFLTKNLTNQERRSGVQTNPTTSVFQVREKTRRGNSNAQLKIFGENQAYLKIYELKNDIETGMEIPR